MSIENPFKKNSKEKSIKGDNFTMKNGDPFSKTVGPGLKMGSGDSTEKFKKREEKKDKEEADRVKFFTDVDFAKESIDDILKFCKLKSYSETLRIELNGKFDKTRVDGASVYMDFADTPEGLYQLASEIMKKYPDYHFDFDNDPEGRWVKYTVSKRKKDKFND